MDFINIVKDFLLANTELIGFSIPNWAFVVAGAVVLILLIVIICCAAASAKKKKKKKSAPVERPVETAAPVEEKPAAVEEKEEPAEAPAPIVAEEEKAQPVEEEPVEEAKPVQEEKPVAEAKPVVEEKRVEKPVEKKVVEEKPVEEEKPAEKPVEKKPAPKKAAPAKKEPVKAAEPVEKKEEKPSPIVKRNVEDGGESRRARRGGSDSVFGMGVVEETIVAPVAKKEEPAKKEPAKKPAAEKEVAATDAKKGVIGKFEICNSNIGGFRYLLSANNGQLLYESRDYKTFDGCREAIDKFINAVKAGDFRVRGDKFGNFKYNLKSPTSNNVVFVGESYDAKKKCESAVESVKRFAETAKIVDLTEADFVATSAAFDIPEDVVKEVKEKKGAVGRWEIASAEDNDKAPYVFLLYANNGQLLYESRDYKTVDNCKSGLETFVKTVVDGEFIVDSDKFGRYRFILRKAGNQVDYVGQNYSDKQSAIRSAISVYKFALLTPIEL